MVQTKQDGTILLQIQRGISPAPSTHSAEATLRLQADAATWTALEAIAGASRGNCLDFDTISITIELEPYDTLAQHATAQLTMSDLLLWSLGEIDDAELSARLSYQPPTTAQPASNP
jgi:hypothetical protein